ncbi:MAG: ribosome silencing factor [Thermodesulfobacteriota bacterium]
MESLDKALLSLKFVRERKALEPVLFDVGGLTSFADYFLIVAGGSTRQVQAITRHLVRSMRESGWHAHGVEGEQEGQWVLVDYGDVVVHVFYEPVRVFYDLESLWIEAPRVDTGEEAEGSNGDETGT